MSDNFIYMIGAGIMQIPAITTASAMGLKTIVADFNSTAPGMALADIPVVMSTKDIEGNVRVAKELSQLHNIKAVITVGTDASMTVAAVANALKLSGIKFESAENATNKIKMRTQFLKHNVPSPMFFGVWTVEEVFEATKELKYPFVIKPSDNMGARGVRKISQESEIKEAFIEAKSASPSGQIIIEEYMEGDELSIDMLIFDNEILLSAVADRLIKYPPYFVEVGHTLPSQKEKKIIDKSIEIMALGVKALGINIGAAKGDIKLTKDGPKIGEIAARLSGGFMSGYTYPYATGQNIIKYAIEIALGKKPFIEYNKYDLVAAERAIIPSPGKIYSIEGIEEAKKIDGVKNIFLRADVGDTVPTPKSNIDKIGNIIVIGKNYDETEKIITKVFNTIKISIKEDSEITYDRLRSTAQSKMMNICRACKVCDGIFCAGMVPGMGGVGTGASFKNNIIALEKKLLNLKVIHNIKNPDTKINLFGINFNTPIFAAPITGAQTNLGGAVDEAEYTNSVVKGFLEINSIAFIGDGATPGKYEIGLNVVKEYSGRGIPIFKPRTDENEIKKRIDLAMRANVPAMGMDIDAAGFITMALKNQNVEAKSVKQIQKLIDYVNIPFILKGIMTVEDALKAVDAGAYAIVVSNHGGRVLDHMPGSADVLESIADRVGKYIKILVDGGIRTGVDVLKMMALGADAVLIGRPVTIAAIGGGYKGVSFYMNSITEEFKKSMMLTGVKNLLEIDKKIIFKPDDH